MKKLMLIALLGCASQSILAQGRVGSFLDGFNKGYSDGTRQRAMEQQERLLEEQAKQQRLELRERSGLQNLRLLEAADRRSSERLNEVLMQTALHR